MQQNSDQWWLVHLHTQHGCVIQGHPVVLASTAMLTEISQILLHQQNCILSIDFLLAFRVSGGVTTSGQSIQSSIP